jgi:acetoin utilization protein AcuC
VGVAGEAGDDQRVALVWDEGLVAYDLGPDHPLAPIRVSLTVDLIRRSGLIGGRAVEVAPAVLDEQALLRRHAPDYVAAVRRLSEDPTLPLGRDYGLGPGDTPAFARMHEASVGIAGASVEAARQVWTGQAIHAFNPAGGLHHAMPERAGGFCVYNDPALAIDWLLANGAERVCYVDIDVHHGDGVERMFADDPRVLTISIHESGRTLFPGTGAVTDIGGEGAPGSAVNLPLAPGSTGPIWLGVFDAVIDPLVRAFAPDVLVTQLGCDTHVTDPLAHLALTVDDLAATYRRLHALAHEVCGGRWVAVGGGGYRLAEVVPIAWTLAFAEMTSATLPVETPMGWRELVYDRLAVPAPRSFTEDPVEASGPVVAEARRAAEETVAEVRRRVLPYHGVRG